MQASNILDKIAIKKQPLLAVFFYIYGGYGRHSPNIPLYFCVRNYIFVILDL